MNEVILLGHVGQEPTLRVTTSGKNVCNFTVATNEKWKDRNGEQKERTEWHRIVFWGQVGVNAHKHIKKGSFVFIRGKMQTREYATETGDKRYMTEVVGSYWRFLESRKNNKQQEANGNVKDIMQEEYEPEINPDYTADNIPF